MQKARQFIYYLHCYILFGFMFLFSKLNDTSCLSFVNSSMVRFLIRAYGSVGNLNIWRCTLCTLWLLYELHENNWFCCTSVYITMNWSYLIYVWILWSWISSPTCGHFHEICSRKLACWCVLPVLRLLLHVYFCKIPYQERRTET